VSVETLLLSQQYSVGVWPMTPGGTTAAVGHNEALHFAGLCGEKEKIQKNCDPSCWYIGSRSNPWNLSCPIAGRQRLCSCGNRVDWRVRSVNANLTYVYCGRQPPGIKQRPHVQHTRAQGVCNHKNAVAAAPCSRSIIMHKIQENAGEIGRTWCVRSHVSRSEDGRCPSQHRWPLMPEDNTESRGSSIGWCVFRTLSVCLHKSPQSQIKETPDRRHEYRWLMAPRRMQSFLCGPAAC
jgi:hypothetical protein